MNVTKLNQVAEITLNYRLPQEVQSQPQITSSKAAYEILKSGWGENMALFEEFYLLLLDSSARVLGRYYLSRGGINCTIVDARIIFVCALKARATSIILAHNHPSGSLKFSPQDISLTKNLIAAGKLLNIAISDHLILSPYGGYLSYCDEGMMC